jgi:hypothetical protein
MPKRPIARLTVPPRYASMVCDMPPLANLPPYDNNEIVRWFANRYCVTLKEARRLFQNAETQSSKSRHPFLIYDRKRKLWHGVNHQRANEPKE